MGGKWGGGGLLRPLLAVLVASVLLTFFLPGAKADWSVGWDTDDEWREGTYENACVRDGSVFIGIYPPDPFFEKGGWLRWTQTLTEVDEVKADVVNGQGYFYARDHSGISGEYGEAYGYLESGFYLDATGIRTANLTFWWKAYTTDFNQGASNTRLRIELQPPGSSGWYILWERSYSQPQSGTVHDGYETVSIPSTYLSQSGWYTIRIEAYWYLNPTGTYDDELFYWYVDDLSMNFTSARHVSSWRDLGTACAWKTLTASTSIPSGGITATVEVSDDGSTVEGSQVLYLSDGLQDYSITTLPVARYVRVATDFWTNSKDTSPELKYYTVTADPVPSLSSGGVTPSSGTVGTTFTFTVIYQDPDGDPPSYVKVVIDGQEFYMTLASGSYETGATYQYLTATLGAGSHTYYFYASDGTTSVWFPSSGTLSGPTVIKIPTTLSLSPSSFSVTAGGTQTLVAWLSAGGSPLVGKTISWEATAGSLSAASSSTDSSGQATVVFTAPSYATSVTITASFSGDEQYEGSYASCSGSVTSGGGPTPSPPSEDSDGDGMPDSWELQHNLNPHLNDAGDDPDGDGYTNLQEYLNGTDPWVPNAAVVPVPLTRSPSSRVPLVLPIIIVVIAAVVGAMLASRRRKSGGGGGSASGPAEGRCPHCKTKLPPDADFCPECGKKVRK